MTNVRFTIIFVSTLLKRPQSRTNDLSIPYDEKTSSEMHLKQITTN